MQETTTRDYVPVCGEDFCESCGDCLACYGGDPCYTGGSDEDCGEHCWPLRSSDEREPVKR